MRAHPASASVTTTAARSTSRIKPDATVESVNETFYVRLSNPTNATIADGEAEGTIVDDDDLDLDADPFPEPFQLFGA